MDSSILDKTHDEWLKIIETSGLQFKTICIESGVSASSLRKWVTGRTIPNSKSKPKLLAALKLASETPPHPYHPSFGWLTIDEVALLKNQGIGSARSEILRLANQREKMKGKVR